MGNQAELVQRLLAGDETTFAEIVTQYHPQMQRVCRIYVKEPSIADEVVQETWLAALEGLKRFEGRSSFKTWLFRILTNRAKTRAVREGRTVPFSSAEREGDQPALEVERFGPKGQWAKPPIEWAPDDEANRAELRTRLTQIVDQLPENQRLVLVLRDLQGWSSDEVCNLLEITETNQRVMLHRARSRARRLIELAQDESKSG